MMEWLKRIDTSFHASQVQQQNNDFDLKDKLDKLMKDLHVLKCREHDKVDKNELKRFQTTVRGDNVGKHDFELFKK